MGYEWTCSGCNEPCGSTGPEVTCGFLSCPCGVGVDIGEAFLSFPWCTVCGWGQASDCVVDGEPMHVMAVTA